MDQAALSKTGCIEAAQNCPTEEAARNEIVAVSSFFANNGVRCTTSLSPTTALSIPKSRKSGRALDTTTNRVTEGTRTMLLPGGGCGGDGCHGMENVLKARVAVLQIM